MFAMKVMERLHTVVVLLLTGAAVYLGLLNLADRLEWKQPWDGIQWVQTSRGLQVGSVVDPGRMQGQGLEVRDRLLRINGMAVRNLDDQTQVLEALAEALPAGMAATYEVRKAVSGDTVSYRVSIDETRRIGLTDFFLGLVAFLHLAIGLYVFLRARTSAAVFHFYLICWAAFILYFYRYSGRADAFDIWIYWLSAAVLLLLPPLFLHFCLKFPEPFPVTGQWKSLSGLVYLPAIALLGVHALWFLGRLQTLGLPRNLETQPLMDRSHLIHFVVWLGAGAVCLLQKTRTTQSLEHRQQMKWVGLGTLIGLLPFALLYGIPYLLGLPILRFMEVSLLGLALLPLSFAYAVTKYRLMDVELIFKKGAAYALASSALLGLYLGLVLLLGRAVQRFSPQSGFAFFALAALLVAFLFAPLRNRIQQQIDRYFYKDRYDYRQSFAEFSKTLTTDVNLSRLAERLCSRLRRALDLSAVAIFLRDESSRGIYRLFYADGLPEQTEPGLSLGLAPELQDDATEASAPSVQPLEQSLAEALSAWQLNHIQPLAVHGRPIGFLGFGRDGKDAPLSSEDLDLIEGLAGYAAIAIDNALLYGSLEAKANELAELKGYNESVIESNAGGIVVVDPEGRITVWNEAMQFLFGIDKSEVLGESIEQIFSTDLIQTLGKVVQGPSWTVADLSRVYKTHVKSRSGQSRLVNITLSPLVSQKDVVTGTLMVFEDITEKVKLENQLLQAEKLSSIGLFAAGVAHEVNTPLAGISSYAQILLKDLPPEDPRHAILKKIERQSFRASDIVNNLLNFARFSDTELKEVQINSLMTKTLSLLDHQFRKGRIDVSLSMDPLLRTTLGNGGKLQQVFMNLFLNAKDAMPEGGTLSVRTYRKNSSVVVEVGDTGTGISEANVKKIYDPFFTTKEVGKGTGLGLSICYGIIQEHSGQVSVESEPGKGTVFRVHLPLNRIN